MATLVLVSAAAMAYVVFGPDWLRREVYPNTPPWLHTPILRSVHVLVFVLWTPAWVDLCRVLTQRAWGWLHLAVPPLLAIVGELVQIVLPGHAPDLRGALASLSGVALGLLWVWTMRPTLDPHRSQSRPSHRGHRS